MATSSWTTPKTWASGETPTTGNFLTYIRDNMTNLGSPAMVLANRTTTAALTTSVAYEVQFNAADTYDTDAMHSTSTNNTRLVVPSGFGGMWMAWAEVDFDSSTAGYRRTRIIDNGGTSYADERLPATPAGVLRMQVQTPPIALSAGDYLLCEVLQVTGGGLNLRSARFAMWQVGRTEL